ncbi:MAG: tetratricopeptide repeat protein, partial [Acidobacteriota bacterium]
EARRLDPKEPTGYVLAALLLREGGRRAEAVELLQEGLAQGVEEPELAEELSFLLLSMGERQRARDVARDGLERHPRRAGLKMALGLAMVSTPDGRRESVELLSQALELGAPDPARVHLELGSVLSQLGRQDEALEHLREAVRLVPGSAEAHYRLGTALRAAGDLAGAQKQLERFQQLGRERDREEWSAKKLRAALNEAQKLALESRLHDALDRLERVLVSYPTEARAHGLRAKVLSSLGRQSEALESITRARELAPHVVEYHYLEGRFLLEFGRSNEGESCLRRALSLDPRLAPAYELLGVLAANNGWHEEAVEHFRRALSLGTDTPPVHLNLAEALRALGRIEESEEEMLAYRRLTKK